MSLSNPSWTKQQIEAERQAVSRILATVDGLPSTKLAFCLERLLEGHADAMQSPMRTFHFALSALRIHERHGGLSAGQLGKVIELAKSLLVLHGVRPTTSKVSFLHGELHETISAILSREGKCWDSLWEYQLAQLLSRKAPPSQKQDQLLESARRTLRLGHVTLARRMLGMAKNCAGKEHPSTAHALLELTCLRCLGEHEEFERRATALATTAVIDEGESLALAREEALLRCQESGKPDALLYRMARAKTPLSMGAMLEVWLWTRATVSMEWIKRLPTLRTIRAKASDRMELTAADALLLRCAQTIELAYDQDRPLEQRMKAVFKVLEDARSVPTLDHELLILAALTRWLARFNQMELACTVLAEYRAASVKASGGQSDDLFGLVGDLSDERLLQRYLKPERSAETHDVTKIGTLHNLAEITKVVARLFALVVKGAVAKALVSRDKQETITLENQAKLGKILSSYLARRKGVLLKVGQMCSYLDGPIGDTLAEQFEVLQSAVTPMSPDAARKVFAVEMGQSPDELFSTWEETPFASGSIGQVHRAVTRDGRRVAVKIQYPYARDMIELDFKRAAFIRPILTSTFPNLNYDELIEEAREHLMLETDYHHELANMLQFREFFARDEDVWIPEPLPELSSARVLTAELVEGLDFREFVETASQAERNRAGETIARMMLASAYGHGMMNVDPQPGNYLFVQGRVAFIDFGCVKRFPDGFRELRDQFNRAFFTRDLEAFGRLYKDVGWVESMDDFDIDDAFRIYLKVMDNSLRDEPYRLTQEAVRSIYTAFSKDNPHRERLRMPRHFLLSSRIEFGLFSVIAKLGAEINWYRLRLGALYGDKPIPPPLLPRSASQSHARDWIKSSA